MAREECEVAVTVVVVIVMVVVNVGLLSGVLTRVVMEQISHMVLI